MASKAALHLYLGASICGSQRHQLLLEVGKDQGRAELIHSSERAPQSHTAGFYLHPSDLNLSQDLDMCQYRMGRKCRLFTGSHSPAKVLSLGDEMINRR